MSAPEPVPRSATRSVRERKAWRSPRWPLASLAGAARADEVSGARTFRSGRLAARLHHRLGLGPRHQGLGVEPQRQPPEFLAAEDARDRLARQPARRQGGNVACFRDGEPAVRLRGETGVIERERVRHQQPRVELGRLQAVAAKFRRQRSTRIGHGGARLELCRQGRHAVPSAASSAA